MIGGRCDSKPDCTIVDWAENLMNVGRVGTIEQEEESPIVILPAPVEVHQETVGLCTGDEIVMNTDALSGDKLMRCDVYTRA